MPPIAPSASQEARRNCVGLTRRLGMGVGAAIKDVVKLYDDDFTIFFDPGL